MKKIIAFLTGLIAFLSSIAAPAQDNSLLWRISGKSLAKPSYLFGTIHLICPDDYLWTEKMKACLDSSSKVCFEMDLSDPTIMMQAMAGMTDNSGKQLKDYFTPEQYKLLVRYIKDSVGLDISLLEHMKPVMLETLISTKMNGCPNPVSYEETIMKTAQAAGKKILGLEDPKEQIDALENMPVDSVVKSLMDGIQNNNKPDTEYAQLIGAYKRQDLPALYSLIINSPDIENEKGPLLDTRNKKWVSRITDKMQGSSVFFAVGAGHLYGPLGVINLLRQQGYKVEPMK